MSNKRKKTQLGIVSHWIYLITSFYNGQAGNGENFATETGVNPKFDDLRNHGTSCPALY